MTAPTYDKITPPKDGTRVAVERGKWTIPNDPIVCLLRGDGIGMDVGGVPGISASAVKVLDAAVKKAYGGKRKLVWFDVHAGDVARKMYRPEVTDAQVGSLNETDSTRGLAHYIEHMAFNGSANFAPGSVVPFFQSLGLAFGRDLPPARTRPRKALIS